MEINKVYLIDKPVGWTSFDVVAKIRSALRKQYSQKIKVGHAGTLDPFASGLLIVLSGDETKKQDTYMKQDKEYLATFTLGATSSTDDKTGVIEITNYQSPITKEDITKALKTLTGTINQIPPKFSAIKVEGKRAYKLARKDKDFELTPRKVTVNEIEVTDYSYPTLSLRIACSSGTYIRSLARDLGLKLGCGAYVSELRRTRIGKHRIEDALTLDDLANND